MRGALSELPRSLRQGKLSCHSDLADTETGRTRSEDARHGEEARDALPSCTGSDFPSRMTSMARLTRVCGKTSHQVRIPGRAIQGSFFRADM